MGRSLIAGPFLGTASEDVRYEQDHPDKRKTEVATPLIERDVKVQKGSCEAYASESACQAPGDST